jgi:hypothetical protein
MANTPQPSIPDLSETALWSTRTAPKGRDGRETELPLGGAGVRISTAGRELTCCPVLVWHPDNGCNFVIFKTGERNDRGQFFYRPYKRMGIGTPQCGGLAARNGPLLHAQAGHVAEQRGGRPTR